MSAQILAEIVSLASQVTDTGVLAHLRAAFVRQSNVVLQTSFGNRLPGYKKFPTNLWADGKQYPATVVSNGTQITLEQIDVDSLSNGEKLQAVKTYKTRTGRSLMESKTDIEAWMAEVSFPYSGYRGY